jgi:V-type H+-transporting ATPase subunit d
MRSSFLKDSDYHHLTQCETLDDVRLNMTESDYNECIADSATMTPASLQKSAILKVRRSLYRYTGEEAQRVVTSFVVVPFTHKWQFPTIILSLFTVGHGIQVLTYPSGGTIEHFFGFYYVRIHD